MLKNLLFILMIAALPVLCGCAAIAEALIDAAFETDDDDEYCESIPYEYQRPEKRVTVIERPESRGRYGGDGDFR